MKEVEAYISKHESYYQGKYYHHSSFQMEPFVYKFHYYMRDIQLQQIDIYLEIHCQDKITYRISEELHEYEENYIVVDALKRIRDHYSRPAILHCDTLKPFIEGRIQAYLYTQDYINILNYLKYHDGLNQKTIDRFYTYFMPYLESLFERKLYLAFMDNVLALVKEIAYEYKWQGATASYLDSEYQHHLYYLRQIFEMISSDLEEVLLNTKDSFIEIIESIFQYPRFAFSLVTLLESILYSNAFLAKEVLKRLEDRYSSHSEDSSYILVYDYYKARFQGDTSFYHDVLMRLFRKIMNDILTLANHDIAYAIGNMFLNLEGYRLLIDLFEQDYNSYIFVSFPISTIPRALHARIRYELENAVRFYAARMNDPRYSLSSFEQVANINRLLMHNFKEEG